MRISDWSSDVCSSDLLAQKAADRRADDEADAEGGADEAEVACTLLRPGDVGDRRLRRRIAAPEQARQRPRDEQPPQRVDDHQQRIVGRETRERAKQTPPSTEQVGQISPQRRARASTEERAREKT